MNTSFFIFNNASQESEESTVSPALEIAWLMSFPNSGTTYTNHLIQQYTNTTTATNYGKEQSTTNTSIPVFLGSDQWGPYFRYPSWQKPSRFILTKTHCASSTNVHPIENIDTLELFESSCSAGSRIELVHGIPTKIHTIYDPKIVHHAVHVIRNPFDNVVARLHMKLQNWRVKRHSGKMVERLKRYNATHEGFKEYCAFRDVPFSTLRWNATLIFGSDPVKRKFLLQSTKRVPCYEEFIRYTRWHNYAVELIQQRQMEVKTLFYEDYDTNFNETVEGLLGFLFLSPAPGAVPPTFISGKHYSDFYDVDDKKAIQNLVLGLASKELHPLLSRYFD